MRKKFSKFKGHIITLNALIQKYERDPELISILGDPEDIGKANCLNYHLCQLRASLDAIYEEVERLDKCYSEG